MIILGKANLLLSSQPLNCGIKAVYSLQWLHSCEHLQLKAGSVVLRLRHILFYPCDISMCFK
jgi:hypothetical protein